VDDFRTIAFWKQAPDEDADEWYDRICDALSETEADPQALFGCRITSHAGTEALNGFLKHADPEVRRIALEAWTHLDVSAFGTEETISAVLETLSDPVEEVRVAALRCCRRADLRDAEPVLLRLLQKDSTLRERLKNSIPGRRSPLAAEFVGLLELLDLKSAAPPLSALGCPSRYLNRHTRLRSPSGRFPAPFVGRYVHEPAGQTPLLPRHDSDLAPACPECGRRLWNLASLRPPHGPEDGPPEGVPLYHCMTMDSPRTPPLFVRLLERPEVLTPKPVEDVSDDYEAWTPSADALNLSIDWTPAAKGQDPEPWVAQLGGEPRWIQGDETPVCPVCDTRMDFVAALPAKDDVLPLYLGSGRAVVYGFWCGPCRVSATRLQA
jgi:hypothetical protein